MEELNALQQNIAENMRRLRKSNNLTYKQAAKALGISLTQYTRTEGGTANTSIITIAKAALLFKVSISEIVFGKDNLSSSTSSIKTHQKKSLKQKLQELEKLSNKDKEIAYELIDLLIIKEKLKELGDNSTPSDN